VTGHEYSSVMEQETDIYRKPMTSKERKQKERDQRRLNGEVRLDIWVLAKDAPKVRSFVEMLKK